MVREHSVTTFGGSLFTGSQSAGDTVARLITAAGFDPVKVGGVDQSIRIEFGGDLAQFGGLKGKLLTVAEAEALIGVRQNSFDELKPGRNSRTARRSRL